MGKIQTYLGKAMDGHTTGVLTIIANMDQLIAIRQLIETSPALLETESENAALRARVEKLEFLPAYILSGEIFEKHPLMSEYESDARYTWPDIWDEVKLLARAALEGQ